MNWQTIRLFLVAAETVLFAAAMVGCHHAIAGRYAVTAVNEALAPDSMSAEQALHLYLQRAERQLSSLAEYSDETTIEAEVPANSAAGRASLKETFSTPRTLSYTDVHFVGNGFIKNEVIFRLLGSDVDHVHRGMEQTAILASNYKFLYKDTQSLGGRPVYSFEVMPRREALGLFKGKVFLDPQTGHLVRAMGRLSRSPSWWIKRVDFSQDYGDFGEFTLPIQLSSVTEARVVGRVLVTIRHSAYEVRATQLASVPPGTSRTAVRMLSVRPSD